MYAIARRIEGYILDSEKTEPKVFKLTETTQESRLITVPLKGKYQKKNVSDNPSMDSFTKIYIDFEKLWPKIFDWGLFELTLQNAAKNP